jgi:hypothetical protein
LFGVHDYTGLLVIVDTKVLCNARYFKTFLIPTVLRTNEWNNLGMNYTIRGKSRSFVEDGREFVKQN